MNNSLYAFSNIYGFVVDYYEVDYYNILLVSNDIEILVSCMYSVEERIAHIKKHYPEVYL
jgi:hypothetical protein